MSVSTQNIGSAATPVSVYISSGSTAITFMSFCNYGASPVHCDIHIVPNGDGPTNSNLFIKDLEILAGDTFILYQGGEKILMDNLDTVQVVSDIANSVTVITSFAAT